MTIRRELAGLDDQDLGAALQRLSPQIDWPAADPIAPAVMGRLATETAGRRLPFLGRSPRRLSRALLIAIAALLLVAAIATAIGLGVPGIRILFGQVPSPSPVSTATLPPSTASPSAAPGATPTPPPSSPTPNTSPLGAALGMGRMVPIDEARTLVDFPILQPTDPTVGPPAEVWVDGNGAAGAVTQLWPAGSAGPAAPGTRIGLLLSEFRGSIQPERMEKILGPQSRVVPVAIGEGITGYWIEGAPHQIVYFDAAGRERPTTVRLVGKVLIWAAGDLTFRLETTGDMAQAVKIAASLK